MTRGDDHAIFDEGLDRSGRDAFRRGRQQRHSACQRFDHVQFGGVRRVEKPRVVHAAPRAAEIRTFEMDAQHAGYVVGDGRVDRRERAAHLVRTVADERWQKTRRAELSVRRTDCADTVHVGPVVEQHAAAAVDLRVDEAWQQNQSTQVVDFDIRRDVACRDHGLDATVFDEHGDIVVPTLPGKYACIDECRRHHTVSVTLARCGGRSGSRPRRIASALTAR